MGKACAIPANEVHKKYPAATDAIAASAAVPLKTGDRLLQIVAVDDDGVIDDDDQMPVFLQISPFVHIIPQGAALPSFEPSWRSKYKKIARS